MSEIFPTISTWELGAFLKDQLDDLGLDVYEFRVYLHLCRRIGNKNRVFERQAKMAEICGMSRRKVNESLQSLQVRGLIFQHPDYRDDGGRTTNKIEMIGVATVTLSVGGCNTKLQVASTKVTAEVSTSEVNTKEVKNTSLSSFAEKIVLIWNENCGQLPQADFLNKSREKKIEEYLSECTDEKSALEMFETAVKEAATDSFWISKRLKIDTMLKDSKVFSMVEGSRAKNVAQDLFKKGSKEVPPPVMAPNPDAPPVGSKWVHPGSRMPLEVEFVKDNSVFFVDGGPIDECFVYEMVGWQRL